MSDKCEWCGLAAEHESRLCILKDNSTHRMTLDLAAAPMSVALLYWIKNEVDEAQAKHGKMVELTIKHIGHWPATNLAMNQTLNDPPTNVTEMAAGKQSFIPMAPKHEPFLIIESSNESGAGQWKCSGCGTWYPWASMDENELEHCPKCCGVKIKCPAKVASMVDESKPVEGVDYINRGGATTFIGERPLVLRTDGEELKIEFQGDASGCDGPPDDMKYYLAASTDLQPMPEKRMSERRQIIENTIRDLVTDFMRYDRKEDENLSAEDIEEAVKSGEVTVDGMVKIFRDELTEYLNS